MPRLLFAVTLMFAFPSACLGDYAGLPVKLDFGTSDSPVYDVYDRATALSVYDGKAGWTRAVLFEERDRGGDDLLTRDFIFAREPATFRIALPNGMYRITMVYGDLSYSHPAFAFRASGADAFEVPALSAGRFAEVVFRGGARKGILEITFIPITSLWLVNGMTIEAMPPGHTAEPPKYRFTDSEDWRPAARSGVYPLDIKKLRMVKKPRYDSPSYPDLNDYMRVLERFPLLAERGWHANYNDLPDVGYFGDGSHAEMGLRSMGNFIFTCALLASDPAYDPRQTGIGRDRMLDYARRCLRYMTRAHVTGDLTCADGKQWGDHWQSAWWTAKMAAGARLIWDELSHDERVAVERVVVHEANRHLDRKAPGGSTSNTRSEENAWDTEALAWAFGLFPEHPNAPKWWRKLQEFCMNTLSVPQDREDSRLVDFRPVNRWVYTENVHADFTIENHGAYHFCYMACPLHSLAWGWYGLISNGQPVPNALFHHYRDVWDVIRRTFLYESRFAYLSGKDWPRYAYGLYFIMPALVLLQEEYGDRDARLFEKLRFKTFEREQIMNADGTFYGRRFTRNRMLHRQLEYETDTYANLGLCYLMHKAAVSRNVEHASEVSHGPSIHPLRGHSGQSDRQDPPFLSSPQGVSKDDSTLLKQLVAYIDPSDPDDYQRRVAGTFISKDSAFAFSRSPKVFTSFSWRELHGPYPVGLFIPAGCDHMVEWGRNQLVGSFSIQGCNPKKRDVRHFEESFEGGFSTVGCITYEKPDGSSALNQYLAFVSLAKEGIALIFDRGIAASDIMVNSHEGLCLYLANDIFNSGRRTVRTPRGEITLWGGENTARTPADAGVHTLDVPWLSIDGKLSLVALTSGWPFTVRDIRGRAAPWNSIEYELIALPYVTEPREFAAGETVRDIVLILAAGDDRFAANLHRNSRLVPTGSANVRCAVVSIDGERARLVAVNFGDEPAVVRTEIAGRSVSLDIEATSAVVRPVDLRRGKSLR